DHEKTPVDRRVEEDRVEPEQGVEDVDLVQLRVLEDRSRLVLVERDAGEDERQRHELAVEDADARRDPRQPGDRDRDDRERDVERKEVDRGCVDVAAPSDRDADPNEVEREGPRDDAQLTRPLVSLDELPEQTTCSPERDRVERNEKGVSEEADADRDQRKSCKRDEPRLAAKDPSEQR